ncbi:Rop guanine nucleotide exchange factor 12, partial [Mucuna pruriens]
MVRAGEQEQEGYKPKLFTFRGIFEGNGRHTKSLSVDTATTMEPNEDGEASSRSQGSKPLNESEKIPKARVISKEEIAAKEANEKLVQDMEQMRERFSKLLLGEDMSGGGKGVSSALALSNAFTNLAASIFGEQRRLEPMPAERKAKWRKEIDWLLSVTDYVVEMVPSQQKAKDGTTMEIMTTRQRTDLHMNIPALRKLDTMLIECLDNFKDQNEFYYVSKDSDDSDQDSAKKQNDEKWWLPVPKVPADGLSDGARKFLQYQKDCVNQVLKAAMAINAQIITEMEIPDFYIEALPKNGRASLGDSIYRSITVEFFDPDQLLSTMDLSSEHKILDLKNRIEASIVIWKRKMNQKDSKSSWGSAVSLEKRELFEERAETILLLLKHRFPGLAQSSLDISKIQYNKDVGQAVLESYSRILESLAFTVRSRIDDVLQADYQIQSQILSGRRISSVSKPSPREEIDKGSAEAPGSMTLSDFMGWGSDQGDSDMKKDQFAVSDDFTNADDAKQQKLQNVVTNKKMSYLENLGVMRSPTSRH